MMSKEFQLGENAQDTIARARRYYRFVRTQPQSGWGADAAAADGLRLAAFASAGC